MGQTTAMLTINDQKIPELSEGVADEHASGYPQIPDTSWWEGEPDAALVVGERRYRPSTAGACLTLAAVYRWDGHPCYWLAVTRGSIVEWEVGGERVIEELLIPAVQGKLLGEAGVAVGRLTAPLTSAHRLKPKLKREAANLARQDAAYLANLLNIYQQHEGIDELHLATRLGCSRGALDDIFLCLRPEANEQDGSAFSRYVRLVASVAGVPAHLLGATLRSALYIERKADSGNASPRPDEAQ